jgi:hypothetical protein
VGYTLFLHPAFSHLINGFRIPLDFAKSGDLIAIILPWTLSPGQLENRVGTQKGYPPAPLRPTLEEKQWSQLLRTNSSYHRGLRILGFPKDLQEYISQRESLTYCIWAEVPTGSKQINMEAKLLEEVLKPLKARKVPGGSNCRIVFVHLGALKTLNRFPALAMKRAQHHQMSFYTFGTQGGTSTRFWCIEEIYPCGSWLSLISTLSSLNTKYFS